MAILNFVLGRCGNGKSQKLKDILQNKIKSGNNKIIWLVPEQSSFANEKSLLELLGNENFGKIKVLSFSRLYDFVADILKIPPQNVSDDIARIIMVNRALEIAKPKLKIYKKNCMNLDLAQLVLKTIHEFKSNKIEKKALEKICRACNKDILKQKIEEIILISDIYESLCDKKIKDITDKLNMLENIINSEKVFSGYTVFVDEFSSFNAQQFAVLELMLAQADDLYITFCTDNPDLSSVPTTQSLFFPTDKTIYSLKKSAQKKSVEIAPVIFLDKTSRFRNLELELLEKNIFKPGKVSFNHAPANITLYGASDANDECDYIARTIKTMVIDENYRYRDFVILVRDMNIYAATFKSVFKKYDIPYFLDAPEKLFNKNLTRLIFSAFDAVYSDYSSNDILRYLKSGLAGVSVEEISLVENYILLWGIKASDWLSDFSAHPEGFCEKFEPKHTKQLEELNEIRLKIISPLENFKKNIFKSTGKEISRAILCLLSEINAAENLRDFCNSLEKSGSSQIAEKHSALWGTVLEIINQTALVLGDEKITSEKYTEIFMCAVNYVDCSYIPQSVDSVTVALADRTRLCAPKTVFIAGAAYGEFPKAESGSEIFTDHDINYMSSLGVDIKDNTEALFLKEKFLAYTAVSAPSQKLFVSWCACDLLKKSKLPSEIVNEIKAVFPKIKILSKSNFSDQDLLFSKSSVLENYAKCLNSFGDFAYTLESYLKSDEEYMQKLNKMKNFLNKNRLDFQNPQNARSALGKEIVVSASQIEKYYTCPFEYFCNYSLKIKPLKPVDFDSLQYGMILHFLMEKIFKKYSKEELINFSGKTLEEEITAFTKEYIHEKMGGAYHKPAYFSYITEKMKKSVIFIVKHICQELEQSKFNVCDTELEISQKGKIKPLVFNLPGETKISVEGKIDRVDIMETPQGNYVRIIDYKTGSKEFKLSDVFYGLNMQMLIYLLTVYKNGTGKYKNVVPAGVLYFTAIKPLIDAGACCDLQKTQDEIRKKLKMNGLVLENESVIIGMEKEAKGVFVPVCIKDGEIKKSDSLININQLETILSHIEKLVVQMAYELSSGRVSARPVIYKNNTSCKWCKYFSICVYEENDFKEIPSCVKNEKILNQMQERSALKDE